MQQCKDFLMAKSGGGRVRGRLPTVFFISILCFEKFEQTGYVLLSLMFYVAGMKSAVLMFISTQVVFVLSVLKPRPPMILIL